MTADEAPDQTKPDKLEIIENNGQMAPASPQEDDYPSMQPEEFGNELLRILHSQRQRMGLSVDMMCSLILRYDNSWIGSIFYSEDGDPARNLSERIAMEAKCPIIDRDYQKPVSETIPAKESKTLPDHVKASLIYSKPAVVAQIGNINITFILTAISPDGTVKQGS